MPATLRTKITMLLALLVGFGLMQLGNTFQGTLLSVRGESEGFSPVQIGAVGAGFWAGIVIGSLRSGMLIERVGHVRTFAALGAIASTMPLLHLLAINPIAWVLFRALTGVCFAGLFIVVESWLNTAATDKIRGQILSIYGMTGLMAGIGGQLLLSATDAPGFVPFCVVAIILAFALVPIALTRATTPTQTNARAGIGLQKLWKQSSFGVVAALLCGVTTGAFFTLGPVFAHQRGLDTREIAIFMASGTLGGFAMALPLGWLSDRFDRRLIIIGAAVAAAMTLFALVMLVPLSAAPWLLCLCAALFGGTFMPTYSIVIAHVNDTIAQDEFVAAAGSLLLIQGAGAAVGPVVAGLAMSAWRQGLAYTLIITQALLAVWGLYRRTVSAAPPEMQKGVFEIEPPVPVGTALQSTHSR